MLIMFATTCVSCSIAAYCFARYESVNAQLFKSDAIASDRANKIQHLQVQIEIMKGRGR